MINRNDEGNIKKARGASLTEFIILDERKREIEKKRVRINGKKKTSINKKRKRWRKENEIHAERSIAKIKTKWNSWVKRNSILREVGGNHEKERRRLSKSRGEKKI